MEEITIYRVKDKTFSSKEEALKYEETLKSDLKTRARNLFLFWREMLGYPGSITAIKLVNNFAGNRKFTFGQYKNKDIGDIIFLDKQYVKWCINNIPWFKLNKMEQVLFDTDTKVNIGGYTCEFGKGNSCESYVHPGETYDNDLINLEIKWIK